jgi:hypothetical protein
MKNFDIHTTKVGDISFLPNEVRCLVVYCDMCEESCEKIFFSSEPHYHLSYFDLSNLELTTIVLSGNGNKKTIFKR